MSTLELKNIYKSYFLGKEEFPVLKGINLKIDKGDFVSLLGESGGGKSTLMNIIGGLDREYTGDVIINGIAQRTRKESDMDKYRRDTIGFIFQSFNLINYLSVFENVLISLKMTNISEEEKKERANDLIKQVGLSEHKNKKPNQLSGGQKQRVAIARALASDPDIILADEPTGALDSKNTKEVLALLRDIAQSGKTIIVVTHSQEVAEYGTRVIKLADGKITGNERIKPAYQTTDKKMIKSQPLSIVDNLKVSFKHFINAWKTNTLVAIGTAIGIFSVILFLGLGTGAKKYMNNIISSSINPNVVTVYNRSNISNNKNNSSALTEVQKNIGNKEQSIDEEQLSFIKKIENIEKVEPSYSFSSPATLKYGNEDISNSFTLNSWNESKKNDKYTTGTKPGNNEIALYENDAKKLKKEYKSLVGENIELTLTMKNESNENIQVTQSYKVSGILESSEQEVPGGTNGSTLILAYTTLNSLLKENNIDSNADFVVVGVDNINKVKEVSENIQKIKISNKKVFATYNMGEILDTLSNVTNIVTYVLSAIAGISLVVSIFMIVVTTYMSVSERTKEIGVLRALGARRKDVSRLFLFESIILGLSSAIIAIILAFVSELAINKLLASFLDGSKIVQISFLNVLFAIIIAIVIAILASLAPSSRAARLNTIDALASE